MSNTTKPLGFPALHNPQYPVSVIGSRLEPFVRAIVEKIQPEKIILFGSYAYGQPNEHSDVDLLVIRKNINAERDSNIEIRNAFETAGAPLLSFTILSKTPERIAERLKIKSSFYEDIVGKGIELYAAE
jgi:predicted nucleotidyltransferase